MMGKKLFNVCMVGIHRTMGHRTKDVFRALGVISGRRGFSLLEILIALTLLGIIGTVVMTNVFRNLEEGRVDTSKLQMASFSAALKEYRRKCGGYPSTEQGLEALLSKPSGGRECRNYPPGGFLSEEAAEIPLDPWDEPYYYESEGRSFQIYSYGADREEGGEDLDADIYYPPKRRERN